jgi:hypothetical protein
MMISSRRLLVCAACVFTGCVVHNPDGTVNVEATKSVNDSIQKSLDTGGTVALAAMNQPQGAAPGQGISGFTAPGAGGLGQGAGGFNAGGSGGFQAQPGFGVQGGGDPAQGFPSQQAPVSPGGQATGLPQASGLVGAPMQPAPVVPRRLPVVGGFGIGQDPVMGYFFYFQGQFQQAVGGVTIRSDNPQLGKARSYVMGVNAPAGQGFAVGPRESWVWQPGDRMIVEAVGYEPAVAVVPYPNTPQWNVFIAQAQAFTQATSGR